MVHFVGAGPGACDLITVRGQNRIKEADVIIYAGSLVNPELLKLAKPECRIYNSAHMTLEDVLQVMNEAEMQGLTTVRLHTGDPSVYGAIREQMDSLEEMQIQYDVCPGVSAAFGAAASLACEYTLPDVTQTLILTRASGKTAVPEKEQLRDLAAHRASLVLYLSSGLARTVQQELILGGYEPRTSVAVIYKATWPEEKIVRTTLQKLPEDMEASGITKTALIIVSPALEGRYQKSKLYDAAFSTEYRKAEKIQLPETIQKILMIACSEKGYETMTTLADKLEAQTQAAIIRKVRCRALPDISMKESVKQCVQMYFDSVDAILFVSACGIAVRSVADCLTHKANDPAVVCMDEAGKHVISLVSGHFGGANALTQTIADVMWANPVITTATDVEACFSIDDFARANHMVVTDFEKAKKISARVLSTQEKSKEIQAARSKPLQTGEFYVGGYHIRITPNRISVGEMELQLIPRCVVAGIGCKKGTSEAAIAAALSAALEQAGLCRESLCAITSIDIKQEEPGLVEFCKKQKLPFQVYSAEELREVPGEFSASAFVADITGVDNVCERSAMKYVQTQGGRLIGKKLAQAGVTVALAMCDAEAGALWEERT